MKLQGVNKKIILDESHHNLVRQKAHIIAKARCAEYMNRMDISEEKVFKDIYHGFLGEVAFFGLIKSYNPDLYISEPDLEFHKNNKHNCDFVTCNDGYDVLSVSVKTCVKPIITQATWVYQADRLPMNEAIHALMIGYKPCCEPNMPPSIFCLVNVLSATQIKENLKDLEKKSVGKKAIYYEDVKL